MSFIRFINGRFKRELYISTTNSSQFLNCGGLQNHFCGDFWTQYILWNLRYKKCILILLFSKEFEQFSCSASVLKWFFSSSGQRPSELLPSPAIRRPSCVRPSVIRRELSHVKPLNRIKPNLVGMVLGWVPFKIVSDSPTLHSRWLLLLKI